MGDLRNQILEEMGVSPTIDPTEEVLRRTTFLAEYVKAAGADGLVLGISGGVDSSLGGRLCQLAVEKLREDGYEATFHAMRLPHGVQHDEEDAERALGFIGPDRLHTFNIEQAVAGMDAAFAEGHGRPLKDYHRGNVKARLRMVAQYAVVSENNALVVGTDHGAEGITGFFTKYGDGGVDVAPCSR